jgi:erythromycin esterase-like protein
VTARFAGALLMTVFAGGCAVPQPSTPLDGLVRDVCDKSVVLLGEEPHHGGGHTLEVKTELVQRLIERCGFNAVYFESGVFEFVDLNRRLAAGTSAPGQVADAIGGLWSVSSAIDPLVDYLYAQASAGRIRLGGLDPQLGHATSGYLKARLPEELVLGLSEPRRSTCADVVSRRTNWRYDAEHPDDAAARDDLVACFREAGDAAPPDSDLAVLARATLAILTHPPDGGGWDARERQMAALFRWNLRRSPGVSRVIVWTANVHAARYSESVNGPVRPFGDELHAEYGDRLASIAFTALGGAYGRRDATPIPEAGAGSLESQALAGGADPLRYLPRRTLAELGEVDASLFSYDKPRRADWSVLFDGAVVLREEKPLSIDHPPTPRFAPIEGR